ncbi:MAG: hypothetical protein V1905_01815 [bacterium]
MVFKTDEDYIVREKGAEGLRQLEDLLHALKCPLVYSEIKTMDFYPLRWRIISLLAIKEQFDFSDEKIKEMGTAAPKFSLITKIFIKYFSNISLTIKQVPSIWKRHYGVGELTATMADENARIVILRLIDLNIHPVFCVYLSGYFSTIAQMVTGSQVLCRETKCFFFR